jgi:hypothetical protein
LDKINQSITIRIPDNPMPSQSQYANYSKISIPKNYQSQIRLSQSALPFERQSHTAAKAIKMAEDREEGRVLKVDG